MRPWIQGSAAKEEEEHPYELLLTAETKKLVSVDGKTTGRAPTPAPGRNSSRRAEGDDGAPWAGGVGFQGILHGGCIMAFHFQYPGLEWPVTFEHVKQGQGQGGLGECLGEGGGAGSLVAQIDLGSQITNPQVPAVEEQAQQVIPLGLRLTAQTPL